MMKYTGQKWLNLILSALWLLILILRIIDRAPIAVILISLAASILFLWIGLRYARKEKYER